ncbi:MAG TPA: cytochrome c [Anaerolineae bacterium]|nr:cytochrome c [Anaerolineae bacterium]HOR01412.1 cytochrome c [Anaerolineae bacterium]HPL28443.1 cytochrome c [Anaerolineae bacterium]
MTSHPRPKAALQLAILSLILIGTAALYACSAPAAQVNTAAPTTSTPANATSTAPATAAGTPTGIAATGQELANAVCVCHVQNEEGAPPVSELASLPAGTITQTVRQGRSPMPAWNTTNLSDQWLNSIITALQSASSGTPTAASSQLE